MKTSGPFSEPPDSEISESRVNKSARERIGRQDLSQKVPSKKGFLGCDPEVALQTPKPRKIQRHEKVTQK